MKLSTAALVAGIAAPASALVLSGKSSASKLTKEAPKPRHDTFDCYLADDQGKNYVGLHARTASGRSCMNWTKSPKGTSGEGLGNHNYCRNPDGGMTVPYCFAVDTETKEECNVPVCKESTLNPKAWIAPTGAGGKSKDAGKPCTHKPPPTVNFKKLDKDSDKACNKGYGDKMWLIGLNLTAVADVDACGQLCSETAGAEFMTFYGKEADDNGGNCGCYRDACITKPNPGDDPATLTVYNPTSYKIGTFKVYAGAAGGAAAGTSSVAAAVGAAGGPRNPEDKMHGSSTGMGL